MNILWSKSKYTSSFNHIVAQLCWVFLNVWRVKMCSKCFTSPLLQISSHIFEWTRGFPADRGRHTRHVTSTRLRTFSVVFLCNFILDFYIWGLNINIFCCGEGQMYRTRVVERTMSCFFLYFLWEFHSRCAKADSTPTSELFIFECVCEKDKVMMLLQWFAGSVCAVSRLFLCFHTWMCSKTHEVYWSLVCFWPPGGRRASFSKWTS